VKITDVTPFPGDLESIKLDNIGIELSKVYLRVSLYDLKCSSCLSSLTNKLTNII